MQRYWYNQAALLVIYSTIISLTSTASAAFDAEMPVLTTTQHTILTQALYYKKANADVTMTYIKANLDSKSAKLILDTTHTESVVVQSQSKNNCDLMDKTQHFKTDFALVHGEHQHGLPYDFRVQCSAVDDLFINGSLGIGNSHEDSGSGPTTTTTEPIISTMAREHLLHEPVFSLCFQNKHLKDKDTVKDEVVRGFVTFGGVDNRLDLSPMAFALETHSHAKDKTFNVKARAMYLFNSVGDHIMGVSRKDEVLNGSHNNDFALNSLEAYVQLNSALSAPFESAWRKLMPDNEYKNEPMHLTQDQLMKFPTVVIQLAAFSGESSQTMDTQENERDNILAGTIDKEHPYDVMLRLTPMHYMEYDPDTSTYTPRIYFSKSVKGGVLGRIAMEAHNILFDSVNHRIGIAHSSCDYSAIEESTTKGISEDHLDAGVDCKLEPRSFIESCMQNLVGGRDAMCAKLGTDETAGVASVQKWIAVTKTEGANGGKSCEEVIRANAASPSDIIDVACKDGECTVREHCRVPCQDDQVNDDLFDAGYDDGVNDDAISTSIKQCGYRTWGSCSSSCTQTKLISFIDKSDGECHEVSSVTRECHIGSCARDDPCKIPFRVHAVFGFRGGDADGWSEESEEYFVTGLANMIDGVLPGDIGVLMVTAWHDNVELFDSYNDLSDESLGLKVVVEINIFDAKADEFFDGYLKEAHHCSTVRQRELAGFAAGVHARISQPTFVYKLKGNIISNEVFDGVLNVGNDAELIRSWTITTEVSANPDQMLFNRSHEGITANKILFSMFLIGAVVLVSVFSGRRWQASIYAQSFRHTKASLMHSIRSNIESGGHKYAKVPTKYAKVKDDDVITPDVDDDNVLLESDDMEMSASENIATKMPVDVARGASAGW